MMDKINEVIVKILSQQLFDQYFAINRSKGFTIFHWRLFAMGQSGFTGAAAVAIPGLGFIGLAADVATLFTFMAVAALGTGAIIARKKGLSPEFVISKYDYEDILAVWVDAPALLSESGLKAMKFGIKSGSKLSHFAAKLPSKAAAKGSIKTASLASKVTAKILTKMGVKGSSPLLPVVGPVLNGGVNAWFMADIIGVAKEYYQAKL